MSSDMRGRWLCPPLPPAFQHLSAGELMSRGRALADQEKHEDAVMCFDGALSMLSPSSMVEGSPSHAPCTPPPQPHENAEDVVELLINKGIALGKLGRSQGAAQALQSALEVDGNRTTALTYLGLLRVREKRVEEGMNLYRRALAVDPSCEIAAEGLATALTDEGTRLKLAGQSDLAYLKYEEASLVMPSYAASHYNIGITLAERGQVQQALQAYEKALQCCPRYAEAHNNIGVLLKSMNKLPEAIEAYRMCLQVNPNFQLASQNLSLALSDLGTVVKSQGRLDEAVMYYQQALYYNARSPEAMYNLGVAYVEKGCPEKASICYELTTQLNPRCAEAYNNLGVIFKDLDNLPRALQCYESALRVKPTFPEALNNLGVIFTMMCCPEDALSYFNAALQVQPTYAEAYTNLGKFFQERRTESRHPSVEMCEQAKVHEKGVTQVRSRGQDAGDAEKAIEYYEKCIYLCGNAPENNAAHNKLLALNYSILRSREEITEAHEQWGQEIRARAGKPYSTFDNLKHPHKRLKIGYLSPDLNTHSVAYFAEAALKCRSTEETHVTCYYAAKKSDATTSRMQAQADEWRSVFGKPAHEVAEMVRRDQIDILVELAGHTAGNRLDVMALQPAPIQVTWIGYPNTTGLDCIQYRFTDANADPEGTEQRYTEELIRLPNSFLCYTPPPEVGAVAAPPSEALSYITFGSFNNVAKVNARVVRLWARILNAVPDSRMVFKSRAFAAKEVKDSCIAAFAEFGIDRSRIDMCMVMSTTSEHLHAYRRMDISLDTFPYAGTTTTVEALYMGVPVVVLRASGRDAAHAHNVGVSLLSQVGLHELIAHDEDEYAEIAVNLALSPERLRSLRDSLRSKLLASPLCQGQAFMRDVEFEYRRMWLRYCGPEAGSGERRDGGDGKREGDETRSGKEVLGDHEERRDGDSMRERNDEEESCEAENEGRIACEGEASSTSDISYRAEEGREAGGSGGHTGRSSEDAGEAELSQQGRAGSGEGGGQAPHQSGAAEGRHDETIREGDALSEAGREERGRQGGGASLENSPSPSEPLPESPSSCVDE